MTYAVSIAGVSPDPEVYAGLTNASNFIGGILLPAAAKWRALGIDDKARTLFSATQYIDSRAWAGSATLASGTTLQFPRSGDGITDDAATQLANVEKAIYWLAMELAVNPAVMTAVSTASNVKLVDADGAKVEFFAQTTVSDGTASWMPTMVQRLLGRYVAAAAAAAIGSAGGASFGTYGDPAFDDCDAVDRSEAF
jgi:hypothetical protein